MKNKTLVFFLSITLIFILNLMFKIIPPIIMFSILIIIIFIYGFIRKNEILAFLGCLYFNTGDEIRAIPMLKKATDNNCKNSKAYLFYAIYKLKNGYAKESLQLLLKAQSLKPPVMIDKNIMLSLGSSYWLLGDIDKAIEVLEELKSKYDFVNENVLTTLSYMYFLNENFEKATELSEKAIEINPDYASAYDNLGQIYFKKNEVDKALEMFLKAVSIKDLVDSYYFLGVIYKEKGDTETSQSNFKKALDCPISSLNTVSKEDIEKNII